MMHECERDCMVSAHSARVIGQHQKAPHEQIKKGRLRTMQRTDNNK